MGWGDFDHLLLTLPDWRSPWTHTLQSSTEPPWNLTVQLCAHPLRVVVRSTVCAYVHKRVGVKPPPSALRGLSWWDGLGLACCERTAGATPSAALLFASLADL